MKKIRVYTFRDWANGRFVLRTTPREVRKRGRPTIVAWDQISQEDASKIRTKQEELFREAVQKKLEAWKADFSPRFGRSQLKAIFLRETISQCLSIMFDPIPEGDMVFTKFWRVSFERKDILGIQEYIRRTIKEGWEDGYEFVHSPKCRYQNINKIPSQIYAQALWQYHQWLIEFGIENHMLDSTAPKENTGSELDFSDSKANEKMIFLRELGVIDFLKAQEPFSTSTNRLATLLSAITSEKSTTLQPYLNAMQSNQGHSKNDPYNSRKAVEKVRDKLGNIGVKLK